MANIFASIEKYARSRSLPSFLSPYAKQIIAYPRYYSQLKKCRSQYNAYKNRYAQTTLFVAGLPKSGTTWFEKMLTSLPGFSDIMIPEAVSYEQKHQESHSFEFPNDLFKRFDNALVVLKLHAHGSLHNFRLLEQSSVRYVVIYRDLRDVAVSHIFYVRRTAYHPEYNIYKNLPVKDALLYFAKTTLPEFIQWVESWNKFVNSPLSLIIKYEELAQKTFEKMKLVIQHYGINISDKDLEIIIDKNSFENLSGGRKKGVTDTSSFYRSGVSGSWKKHFDAETEELYNTLLQNFFKKYEYEN